jgi:exosortase family protein XrtF
MPDRQLTLFTTKATVVIMNFFSSKEVRFTDHHLYTAITIQARTTVRIHHACNALQLYILYVGFLISYITNTKRVVLFTLLGTIVILCINISRIAILAEMSFKHSAYFSVSHKYIFQTIVYAVVLWLWYIYTGEDE